MNISQFNYLEAALWFTCSLVCFALMFTARGKAFIPLNLVVSGNFLIFGLGDLWEAQTGAWWRPLPLLLLKSVCVLIFILCYRYFLHRRKIDLG